jgi:DNA-binding transcriptional regulator GbsR (MarR family)
VAQIHALLFLSPKSLHAEEIAETRGVARSNVSNSLRELQGWGVVKIVHQLGDRRDHFECMKDVWEMFRVIIEERKRRETDPTLQLLRECVAEAKKPALADAYTKARLGDMLEFFEVMTTWCEQTQRMSTPAVQKMVRLGDKVARMLGVVG